MTNTTEFISIETAADTRTTSGQFWVLPEHQTITGAMYDRDGNAADVEIDFHAAILDIEQIGDDEYRLYGNTQGDRFEVVAGIDPEVTVRLIKLH